MRYERKSDGWWVVGVPLADCPECGPYETKKDAEECKRMLVDFFRENPSYKDE